MPVSQANYEKFLNFRPLNVLQCFGNEGIALVSGRDICNAMKQSNAIAMAANIRNPLSAAGILRAAKKMDSAVILELAKSENTYCGVHFDNLPIMALEYSRNIGHGAVFALHMDHYAIKSDSDRDQACSFIPQAISLGWTSVAVDASHNDDFRNLIYTRDVAMHIPAYISLEVEVGEIRGAGVLSTVEEAEYFIGGLNSWSIFPDYLAISNGSKHGAYDRSSGEDEGIDLNRTLEIADAIEKYGVVIAQHGISGTPLDKVGKFKNSKIHKGNVGTLWQTILFGSKIDDTGNPVIENGSYIKDSGRGISDELWEKIVKWADGKGMSRKSGDYKKSNIVFLDEIMKLEKKYIDRIVDETEEWAMKFFKAFNSEGTASLVIENILKRADHNCAPYRKIIAKREDFSAQKAPDFKKDESQSGNFED
ncbi:MAG: class II fructose-bisphosphate aldolase [Candidatus Coatesbacteria bacterium]|nr:class II fructose-bisphosphate aldolase [Candidatus Coatesbacteria bacterium]